MAQFSTERNALLGNNDTLYEVVMVANEYGKLASTNNVGKLYSFNNAATHVNRGWTMDNTMRPVVSFQNGSPSDTDIIEILEYD